MNTAFCINCRSSVAATIEARRETFPVRGEDIEVETQVAVCPECGEDLSIEELDILALEKAFTEYRRRHGLLSPEEIRQIREKYGLSQRAFALVMVMLVLLCSRRCQLPAPRARAGSLLVIPPRHEGR